MPRLAALGVALAAAVACAPRAPAPKLEKVAEFTPIPVMDAAHVTNPHDHQGKPLCQRCHEPGKAGVSVDPIALCAQCHDPKHMKHPYDVPATTQPVGLPTGPGARIVCHTCHDPHDVKKNRAGLRLAYMDLCQRCHVRHGAKPRPAAAPAAAPTPAPAPK